METRAPYEGKLDEVWEPHHKWRVLVPLNTKDAGLAMLTMTPHTETDSVEEARARLGYAIDRLLLPQFEGEAEIPVPVEELTIEYDGPYERETESDGET